MKASLSTEKIEGAIPLQCLTSKPDRDIVFAVRSTNALGEEGDHQVAKLVNKSGQFEIDNLRAGRSFVSSLEIQTIGDVAKAIAAGRETSVQMANELNHLKAGLTAMDATLASVRESLSSTQSRLDNISVELGALKADVEAKHLHLASVAQNLSNTMAAEVNSLRSDLESEVEARKWDDWDIVCRAENADHWLAQCLSLLTKDSPTKRIQGSWQALTEQLADKLDG